MQSLAVVRLTFVLLWAATGAIGQDSTSNTQTHCTLNGDYADCRSTTHTNSSSSHPFQDGYAAGQMMGAPLARAIANHRANKWAKKYCKQHPGENWGWKLADGSVTSSGVCPGQIPFDTQNNREVTADVTAVEGAPQSDRTVQQEQDQEAIEKLIHPETLNDIQSGVAGMPQRVATPAMRIPAAATLRTMSDEEAAKKYISQGWCEADALHGASPERSLVWRDGACHAKDYFPLH
jgi:hypothetical protein